MTKAHDLYAETNPAFCTILLESFISAYQSVDEHGPTASLAYLAIPLALSGDLASGFGGTNRNTGLLVWLERQPMVRVDLDQRVNGTADVTTEALQMACLARVVELTADGRLILGPNRLKSRASMLRSLQASVADAVRHAGRLGHWFAFAGSERAVFNLLGAKP